MSFDRPWLLFALVLAALPALFHFSRYVRSQRLLFPAALHLFGIDRRPLARLRGRQIVAAAVRSLALAAAVLAFAGPRSGKSRTAADMAGLGRTVVVVDDSPSMAALTGDVTALQAARSRIIELAGEAGGQEEMAVVRCSSPAWPPAWLPPAAVTPGPLSPSDPGMTPCDLTSLVARLIPTLSRRDRMVVLTDGQTGPGGRQAWARLMNDWPNLSVELLPGMTANLTIEQLRTGRHGVMALVRNQGPGRREAVAQLDCQGELFTTAATIDEGSLGNLLFDRLEMLPPGLCTVSLIHRPGAQSGGAADSAKDESSGHDDADSFAEDDRAWMELGQREPPRFLVVDGSLAQQAGPPPSFFVASALRAWDPQAVVVRLGQHELTVEALQLADVVALVDPQPLPDFLERAVLYLLARGGGLLLLAGDNLLRWPASSLLLPGLDARRCVSVAEQPYIIKWLAEDDQVTGDLARATALAGRSWTNLRHLALSLTGRSFQVLGRFSDEAPALLRLAVGDGTMLIWTLAPEADNGAFAIHPLFPLAIGASASTLAVRPPVVRLPPACVTGRPCRLVRPDQPVRQCRAAPDGSLTTSPDPDHEGESRNDDCGPPGLTAHETGDGRYEGGRSGRRQVTAVGGELLCPEPGPYFSMNDKGRSLAFTCRLAGEESLLPELAVGELRGGPRRISESPVETGARRFGPYLVAALLLLLLLEIRLVSGRRKEI